MINPHTFVPIMREKRRIKRAATPDFAVHDTTFAEQLGRAFYWQHLLNTGIKSSGSDIARAEGLHHSVVNELLRLTLLSPELIDRILTGHKPSRLYLMWFQRHSLPVDWEVQARLFSSFDEDKPWPNATSAA